MQYLTPALIWDAALVILVLHIVIRDNRSGFVSSFIRLLGTVASCIVAALLSGRIAGGLYDTYLAETVENALTDTMAEKLQVFSDLLQRFELSSALQNATGDIVRLAAVSLLTMAVFIIIFIIAMLVVWALIRLTRGVNKVPIIGWLNRLLGTVLGVAEAFVLCWVIGMAATVLITISQNAWSWLNSAVVENTFLLEWFILFKLPA